MVIAVCSEQWGILETVEKFWTIGHLAKVQKWRILRQKTDVSVYSSPFKADVFKNSKINIIKSLARVFKQRPCSCISYTKNKIHCSLLFCFQGPLPNTCGHFWEMVWEQRTRGVVMLNRVIEKGSVSSTFTFLLLTVKPLNLTAFLRLL